MTATVIIPARYGSTRMAGKILAAETGRPLVQHVVDQVRKCRNVREIIVAVDDPRIADALRPFDTRTILTSPDHQSGTDRIAEVAAKLGEDAEIIINVQGDEPEIEPGIVDALIDRLKQNKEQMATCATLFPQGSEPSDPNLVKVLIAPDGQAIYFSRSPIPYHRDPASATNLSYYLHLGIYGYRRRFLLEFASWPPTPAEQTEKLEQLRALEHGKSIYVLKVDRATHGIDTAEQYADFVKRHSQKS